MHSLHIKLVRYPLQLLYFLPSAEKMHFLMKWNIIYCYLSQTIPRANIQRWR